MRPIYVCAAIFIFLMQSVANSADVASTPEPGRSAKQDVARFLRDITGRRVVSGIHNREPNSNPSLQTDHIVELTGEAPALWSGDFLFRADDINSRWAMIYECKRQWDAGSIVQIMLHVGPPHLPEATEWDGGVLSRFSDDQWKDLITDGGTLNGLWKERLNTYAVYLNYLKRYGVTVLFRPFHEMNQGKFWWGGRPGREGTRKLFELTHHYLTTVKGLTNLVWVWDMQDLSRGFEDYRPAAECWDIFAFDIYADGWNRSWYDYIIPIVGDKPMIIGECARLPSPEFLEEQPRWSAFMSWAELTFTDNTPEEIVRLYRSPRVMNRDDLPKTEKPSSAAAVKD